MDAVGAGPVKSDVAAICHIHGMRPVRAVLGLLALVLLMSGCGGMTAQPLVANSGTPGLLITPPGLRPPAPAVRGDALQGGTVDLADYAGQIVLLNAYASWCPPCLDELPELAAADRDLPNLQVIGINIADTPKAGLGVLTAVGADYPAIFDPRGLLLAEFTATPTRGLPFSVLIDEQGKVAGRIVGPATEPMLTEAIQRIAG